MEFSRITSFGNTASTFNTNSGYGDNVSTGRDNIGDAQTGATPKETVRNNFEAAGMDLLEGALPDKLAVSVTKDFANDLGNVQCAVASTLTSGSGKPSFLANLAGVIAALILSPFNLTYRAVRGIAGDVKDAVLTLPFFAKDIGDAATTMGSVDCQNSQPCSR